MDKYTPGPWKVENDSEVSDSTYGHIIEWPWRIVAKDKDYDYRIIADFAGGHNVSEANARLMAAAPELLAACEALVKEFEEFSYLPNPTYLHRARKAIAKAKGE